MNANKNFMLGQDIFQSASKLFCLLVFLIKVMTVSLWAPYDKISRNFYIAKSFLWRCQFFDRLGIFTVLRKILLILRESLRIIDLLVYMAMKQQPNKTKKKNNNTLHAACWTLYFTLKYRRKIKIFLALIICID